MKTSIELNDNSAASWQRYSLNGETMGTRYSAVFYSEKVVDEGAIKGRLFAAVDEVDRQMSSWKPDSDLNRLNGAPVDEWIDVPTALLSVLSAAQNVSRQSHGAFEIGVGDLVHAWGFGPASGRVDEKQIIALKARSYQPATETLEIDHAHFRVRKRAAMTLDLSGIAKGFGVDQMAQCLDSMGITRYLVGIDGEMRARGTKPDGRSWAVAIEKPVRELRDVMGVIELDNAAIATSGDYRHWIEHDGKSHAHTMSGASREPVANTLASVSVVAPTCMLADAWATALLVLGEPAGVELAQARGMTALFVRREGEEFREIYVGAPDIAEKSGR